MSMIEEFIEATKDLPPVPSTNKYRISIGPTIDKYDEDAQQYVPWSTSVTTYHDASYVDVIGVQAAQLWALEKLLELGRSQMGTPRRSGPK